VYGINARTGRHAWHYTTGGPVRSGPQPGGPPYSDYVYVGSEDGSAYGLGAIKGDLVWKFPGGPVTAGIVYALGDVVVCDGKGTVSGLYGEGPPRRWVHSVGGAIRGTPAWEGETLYVGTVDSSVYALNLYGGNQSWRFPASGPVNSGLATDGSTVYVGDDDGYVYAIDITTTTPAPRWKFRAGRAVRSQILLANGVVYFGSLDHYVYALRA